MGEYSRQRNGYLSGNLVVTPLNPVREAFDRVIEPEVDENKPELVFKGDSRFAKD